MPTDTAPFDVTATTAPVITTIAAVDPAIVQVPQGHFLLVDALTVRNARTDAERIPEPAVSEPGGENREVWASGQQLVGQLG